MSSDVIHENVLVINIWKTSKYLAASALITFSSLAVSSAYAAERTAQEQLLLKAKALSFSAQPAAAIPIYKQALANDPNSAAAYAGLGWVYYQTGHSATAITYIQRSIKLDPGNAEPHYFLAAIYTSQKHYQTAGLEQKIAADLAKLRPCNCAHPAELLNRTTNKSSTTIR